MKKPPACRGIKVVGLRQLCELCGPLRALRLRISLSPADSLCAKLAKDRKARGGGVVSKEGRPYRLHTEFIPITLADY